MKTGTTSLVTLALLTAGERPTRRRSRVARVPPRFGPQQLRSTYAIGSRRWSSPPPSPSATGSGSPPTSTGSSSAQIKPGDRVALAGSWTYSEINAARRQLEHPVRPARPERRQRGRRAGQARGLGSGADATGSDRQHRDGGWGYTPRHQPSTGSMTCAGISSLIITGLRRYQGQEFLQGDDDPRLRPGGVQLHLQRGIDWLASHFQVGQNFGHGQQWKYYYLYGLERAGRLAGARFFGEHDWYREGAEELVHDQDPLSGFWQGPARRTSWSRPASPCCSWPRAAPVLINKLRHAPAGRLEQRPRRRPQPRRRRLPRLEAPADLAGRRPRTSRRVQDMLQAPIVFFNGHEAPEFSRRGQGRTSASTSSRAGSSSPRPAAASREFDRGLPRPDEGDLPRARVQAPPAAAGAPRLAGQAPALARGPPALGDRARLPDRGRSTRPRTSRATGTRSEHSPANPAVIKRSRSARTSSTTPPAASCPPTSWRSARSHDFKAEAAQAGRPADRQAQARRRLEHRPAGDPQPDGRAPQAAARLRRGDQPEGPVPARPEPGLLPADLHPRPRRRCRSPRRTWTPCASTSTRAAARSSPTPPAAAPRSTPPFRRFVAELLPEPPAGADPPRRRAVHRRRSASTSSDVQYTKAAGGGKDFPQLEGVKINGHWAIIYSKYDIGCALERHPGLDCKGYTHESAVRIAGQHRDLLDLPLKARR